MKKGDFILIDYIGRVAETGEVFDLTVESIAKKEGIFNKNYNYKPILVIVGAGMVIPGVERRLKQMKPGEELTFIVDPDEAFGKRNIKLIKVFHISRFLQQKIDPKPGDYVEINGIRARISSVSGGRVRVDFNHPLAGKKLQYTVKIVKEIKGTREKVKAILEKYGIASEIQIKEGNLILKVKQKPNEVVQKLIKDIIKKWVNEIKSVKFEVTKK